MRPMLNCTKKTSTTPWRAPVTPPKKPKRPRKTSPRRPSGERNEPSEANGLSKGIDPGEGACRTEETDAAAAREFSSARRRLSFPARLHTARLRRPSTALPRRVLSVRQPRSHDSSPRRRGFRPLLGSAAARSTPSSRRRRRLAALARLSPQSSPRAGRAVPELRALRPHPQAHQPHAPWARAPRVHGPARPTLRPRKNVRTAERKVFFRKFAASPHRLEHAELASSIRLLRPRPQSNPVKSQNGSSGRPAGRR